MKLNEENLKIILNALESDTVGRWGDERDQKIQRAIIKIKAILKEGNE